MLSIKNLVAQSIGFVALILLIIVFQKNNRKSMLNLLMLAALLFSVHFLILGALTGAVMNLLNVFRSFVFAKRDTHYWAKHNWWLYIFLILAIFLGLLTWSAWYSILAIMAVLFQTTAFWLKDTRKIRLISLAVPPLWFIYNLIVGSIPGMLTEIMVFSSLITAIYRFDINKQIVKNNKNTAKKRS